MRLSRLEQFKRTMADIVKRNGSLGHERPGFGPACTCDGGHARTLYGHGLFEAKGLDEPTTDKPPCTSLCSFARQSRDALAERGREVDFKKLRKFLGRKVGVAGQTERVEVDGQVVDAYLATAFLRNLRDKRVRVATTPPQTMLDPAGSLHIGALDGSWTVRVAGMAAGDTYGKRWPDPVRRTSTIDLAGRRR